MVEVNPKRVMLNIQERISSHKRETDRRAHMGASFFASAASTCSGSGAAQAALIAELCYQTNNDPKELLNAVMKRKGIRRALYTAAITRHQQVGVGPVDICQADLDSLLVRDYLYAARLKAHLTPEELQHIYGPIYQKYQGLASRGMRGLIEKAVVREAEFMIYKKRNSK